MTDNCCDSTEGCIEPPIDNGGLLETFPKDSSEIWPYTKPPTRDILEETKKNCIKSLRGLNMILSSELALNISKNNGRMVTTKYNRLIEDIETVLSHLGDLNDWMEYVYPDGKPSD